MLDLDMFLKCTKGELSVSYKCMLYVLSLKMLCINDIDYQVLFKSKSNQENI